MNNKIMKIRKILAIVVMASLLSWGLALPVGAAQMTSISDTLSDSDLSTAATHTIAWTDATALSASDEITITWESGFTGISSLTSASFSSVSGMTVVAACGAGSDEVTVGAAGDVVTLTVCTGDTVAAGAKQMTITGITNPSSAGSKYIDISNGTDSGRTMVAIIDDVSVTAAVSTSFTFTIAGKNSGTVGDAAGDLCDDNTTTATSTPFGTLTPDVAEIACQTLTVATNALNGFVVTVEQDQNLLSASGADIDTFKDGAGTATPEAWASPSATLGSEATYGHMGVTSSDDLNTNEFADGVNYAGDLVGSARQIFSHTGPADGTTADVGSANVGYKIEVDQLQEAANDYSATLTYVATPTF